METPSFTLNEQFLASMAAAGGQELGSPATPDHRTEFEDVLSRNLPRFRKMAMRHLHNPEDADDAVQDALLSAFKSLARFEGRAQMSSWLMAIVINSARLQLRRRRRKSLSLDQNLQDHHWNLEDRRWTVSELLTDPRPTAEQSLENSQLCELVAKLAQSLPLSQRTALQLHHKDGLSVKQAAELLGLPLGTVKAQLARARRRLTQLLDKFIATPQPVTPRVGLQNRTERVF
ncbi:MAG: sigma-70 family RNA polymerase sigma factor [Terriglobales bacterium]